MPRTGFPGKPKMRHLPNCPNKNGLPGFDCDPPDVDLRPEIAQSFLNEIVFAHRNAAAHDQNLILRGALHSSPQRITIIAATFRPKRRPRPSVYLDRAIASLIFRLNINPRPDLAITTIENNNAWARPSLRPKVAAMIVIRCGELCKAPRRMRF